MKQPPHGGDMQTYIGHYGHEPLDFSTNTNPLGISPLAKQAACEAMAQADRYPDPHCRALCGAIASHEGVPKHAVLCGNGAADLLFRLVLAAKPRTALLPAPAFSEYAHSLGQVGCAIEHHLLEEATGFALTEAILPKIQPGLDMLFLCEPNNPTGRASEPALLAQIADKCGRTGTLLVVDECFNGFLPQPERHSLKGFLAKMPNIVVLKAFTKLYGMAGLRLGYMLCGDQALLHAVGRAGQHWPVSLPAQAAGVAALEDTAYVEKARALIACEWKNVAFGLSALGCRVYPGSANYIFFYSPVANLFTKLAERGVLIRECTNYEGLGKGYYRVAVRAKEENQQLLTALTAACGE